MGVHDTWYLVPSVVDRGICVYHGLYPCMVIAFSTHRVRIGRHIRCGIGFVESRCDYLHAIHQEVRRSDSCVSYYKVQ